MQNEEKLKKFSEEFFGKSMEFLSLKYVETKEEEMVFTCHFKKNVPIQWDLFKEA